eukprot:4346945-Prymnesium_polylepis.1
MTDGFKTVSAWAHQLTRMLTQLHLPPLRNRLKLRRQHDRPRGLCDCALALWLAAAIVLDKEVRHDTALELDALVDGDG